MKTTISIPDPLFAEAEQLALRLDISSSDLFLQAIEAYLQQYQSVWVTKRLDAIYAEEPATIAPDVMQMQLLSLSQDDW